MAKTLKQQLLELAETYDRTDRETYRNDRQWARKMETLRVVGSEIARIKNILARYEK